MKTIAFFSLLLCVTFRASADPAVIIRERAKELSNQNNVRQGVAPPTQATPTPAMAPTAPSGPTLSPALLRFNSELAAIHTDAQVTTEQKDKMAQELVGAAAGAKPSLKSASKLATDVSA